MLVDPPIENLLPKVKNRYDLAIAVAKRNRQLIDGAEPLVMESKDDTYAALACRELENDKVVAVAGLVDPVVPIRPEIAEALMMEQVEEVEDDEWQIKSNQEPEEVEAPVSKIKVIDPEDLFVFPEYDEDDEIEDDSEEDDEIDEDDDYEYESKKSKKLDVDSSDDDEDDYNYEDEDDYASDEDLESLDSSIDEIEDDSEEDDVLAGFEDYSDYDEDDM